MVLQHKIILTFNYIMNRTPEQIKAKVKQMQNLFKAYPDIFPPGYFRFLAGGLKKEITRRTIFMNNDQGFYFSWWQGQRNPKRWKIEKICVSKRRQGIGSTLMTLFLKKIERKGGESVELKVLKSNEAAINFYSKFGFQIVECKGDYWKMIKTKKINKEIVKFRRQAKIFMI